MDAPAPKAQAKNVAASKPETKDSPAPKARASEAPVSEKKSEPATTGD
jgi:hypothetical protein